MSSQSGCGRVCFNGQELACDHMDFTTTHVVVLMMKIALTMEALWLKLLEIRWIVFEPELRIARIAAPIALFITLVLSLPVWPVIGWFRHVMGGYQGSP